MGYADGGNGEQESLPNPRRIQHYSTKNRNDYALRTGKKYLKGFPKNKKAHPATLTCYRADHSKGGFTPLPFRLTPTSAVCAEGSCAAFLHTAFHKGKMFPIFCGMKQLFTPYRVHCNETLTPYRVHCNKTLFL